MALALTACGNQLSHSQEEVAVVENAVVAASDDAEDDFAAQVSQADGSYGGAMSDGRLGPLVRGTASPRSYAFASANKPRPSVYDGPDVDVDVDPIGKRLAGRDDNSVVRVLVRLPDPVFPFRRFRAAGQPGRESLLAERQKQLGLSQDDATRWIAAAGGAVLARRWLTNDLVAEIPVRAARAASSALPGARVEPLIEEHGAPLVSLRGRAQRDAVNVNAYLNSGYRGQLGSRVAGNRVLVGVLEYETDNVTYDVAFPNRLWSEHIGFRDISGYSRVIGKWACGSSGCGIDQGAPTPNHALHGTYVTSVLAGSIELGQDRLWSEWTEQVDRSGIGAETEIAYFRASGASAASAALAQAVILGVDVMNISSYFSSTYGCIASQNEGGLNEAIRNATDAGLLIVEGAGNAAPFSSVCNMGYPSWRPDVVAVNGFAGDTWVVSDGNASRGGISIHPRELPAGQNTSMAAVGLAAPTGLVINTYGWEPNTYMPTPPGVGDSFGGSSLATPIVAGTAALMRQAFVMNGWGSDARILQANLLLQGDAADPQNTLDRSTHRFFGVSPRTGAGNLFVHNPWATDSFLRLQAPWGWGTRSFVIHNGEEVTYTVGDAGPEPAALTEWRWLVLWSESDLNNVSDIDISVWDHCPCGVGVNCAPVPLYADAGYDLKERIVLHDVQIRGRCLQMHVLGYSVAPEGRRVYSADFFHSGVVH
jgi:subtilisin family serine protease